MDAETKLLELSTKVAALEAIYNGYLSWAALIVAILTLLLAGAGIVSFFYFRHIAASAARTSAEEISKEVAERVANDYIQREWPSIVSAHQEIFSQATSADEADKISEVQPDGSGN